jgi:hypothetical protein
MEETRLAIPFVAWEGEHRDKLGSETSIRRGRVRDEEVYGL